MTDKERQLAEQLELRTDKTLLGLLNENFAENKSGSVQRNAAEWPWEREPRMQEVEEYYARNEAALSGAPYAQNRTQGAWQRRARASTTKSEARERSFGIRGRGAVGRSRGN